VQLLLYAGGLITVVVFAIVVTERLVGDRLSQTSRSLAGGGILAGALLVIIVLLVGDAALAPIRPPLQADLTRLIGDAILTRFALAFELLAVLLLTALVGAIYFA